MPGKEENSPSMALAALLDSLDPIAEHLHSEYVAGDGSEQRPDRNKFYLDVTPVGGYSLEDKTGLIKTLEARKAEGKSQQEALKAFEGLDPQAARDAFAKLKELEESGGDDQAMKAALENLRQQLTETFSTEKATWGEERSELESAMSELLIDATAVTALDGKGSIELLLPIIRKQCRVVKDESGKRVSRVFDAQGNELVSRRAENNGKAMQVDELVESLRSDERYARAFDGSGPTGSGGTGTVSPTETKNKDGQHQSTTPKPSSLAEILTEARAQSAGS